MKKIVALLMMVVACLAFTFVGCETTKQNDTGLTDAKSYVKQLYKEMSATSSDYDLTKVVRISGVPYTVTWSLEVKTDGVRDDYIQLVEHDTNPDNYITVKINQTEDDVIDVEYDIVAVITGTSGEKASISFSLYVPKFQVMTYAEYVAVAVEDPLIVDGIVTGIISKSLGDSNNCLYLQDASSDTVEGGYYVYDMSEDPIADLNIQIGQTVRVKGVKDNYNGTLEIKSATVKIMDETVKTVTAVDLTSAYQAASSLKDDALVYGQAMLVTIKGVEITGQDTSNGYYKFKLGELESYFRISTSVCPLNATDTEAFKALHTSSFGCTADVTGVVCVYNSAFYLTPVDSSAISNVQLPERTPAEQVAFEKENLSVVTNITEDGEVVLQQAGLTYSDVKISWASDNECAVVNGDALVVTLPQEATTITLTATLTIGEGEDAITETKTFEVLVDAASTQQYLPNYITEAKEGTFKIAMDLTATGEGVRYFDGTLSSIGALVTTDKAEKAVDVVVAAIDGGYSIKVGEQYLVAYKNGSYNNLKFADEAGLWTWNEEVKLFTADIEGTAVYLGTYLKNGAANTLNIPLSKLSYLSDVSIIDVSQFVGRMATLVEADYKPTYLQTAKEGTYKIAMDLTATGEGIRYFDGTLSSIGALVTTDKLSKAADVVVAAIDGGYSIKVGDQYLVAYKNGSYNNLKFADEAGLWTWNETVKLFTADVEGTAVYLGTYLKNGAANTLNIPLSKLSYLSDVSIIDVSQFVGRMATVSLAKLANYPLTEAKEGTYKIAMDLTATGEGIRYFDGTLSSIGALVTTDKLSKAADVVVAAIDGGYSIKVGDQYLVAYKNGSYNNLKFADEAGLWTWNETVKLFTADVEGTAVYLGTYLKNGAANTLNIPLSKLSYLSDVSIIDVSQFVGRMVTIDFASEVTNPEEGDDGGGETGGDEGGETTGAIDIKTEGENTIATVTISKYAEANGWANATGYSTIVVDEKVTITATGTASGNWSLNTGKYYSKNNSWRLYESEFAKLTFSATTGYKIVSIKITCTFENAGYLTSDGSEENKIDTNNVITVNSDSVELSVAGYTTKDDGSVNKHGNIQITVIEVVYTPVTE